MKIKGLKHSKTGRPYIMRKIVSIRFRDHYGYMVNLECGHMTYLFNGASTAMKLFMMGEPELKDNARSGCQHCGRELEQKGVNHESRK